jgi:hypothetical protein
MYGVVKLLPHNFLVCTASQQLALVGLVQQNRRLVLALPPVVRLAERASRKCISRQGLPSSAQSELVVRLLLQLLVLRQTATQVGIQQLLSVLQP